MYHAIDLAALDEYLSSDDSADNCMMLSDLDGFIHGILCCPTIIPSEEWMPIAFGADPEPLPRSIVQSAPTCSGMFPTASPLTRQWLSRSSGKRRRGM